MTLDDLIEIGDGAARSLMRNAHYLGNAKPDKYAKRRERVRAIVQALQDEFYKKTGTWEPTWPQVEVDILFDEILGKAGEKVAGRDTAMPEAIERSTPATDPAPAVCDVCRGAGFVYVRTLHDPDGPREKQECEECYDAAPAVCEWTRVEWTPLMSAHWTAECSDRAMWSPDWARCPNCKAPIKFTEVKI